MNIRDSDESGHFREVTKRDMETQGIEEKAR